MAKTRILSSLAIAPFFFIIVIFSPPWLFKLFWSAIVLLAAREWAKFAALEDLNQWVFAGVVASICVFLLFVLPYIDPLLVAILLATVALTWLIMVPLWLHFYANSKELPLTNLVLLIVGAVILLAFAMASQLLWTQIGGVGLISLLVITWSADIGAYAVGRRVGRRPLASNISPKKTVEGFFGGLALALIVAAVFVWLIDMPGYQWLFLVFSIVVISYATIGDLFESVLKRRCNLKDSSNLIPGHGGMMDRIDSWLPSMVLWATWFSLVNLAI